MPWLWHGMLVLVFLALPRWTAADIVFVDGQFDPSNWSSTTQGSGSATSIQVMTGGNPDEYYEISTMPTAVTGSTVSEYNFHTGFVYDPATSGAIDSIDWTFDYQNITNAQAMGLAMRQDEAFYTADVSVRTNSFGFWTSDGSTIGADCTLTIIEAGRIRLAASQAK